MALRSTCSWILAILGVVVFILPCMVIIVVIPNTWAWKRTVVFTLLDWQFRWVMYVSFVPLRIIGQDNIPHEPAIIAANHQSSLDILLVGILMRAQPHVWYALAMVSKKPVIGFFLRHMGISLDRDHPERAAQAFIKSIRQVQNGAEHVIIFPEGQRFDDGKIHEFLRGYVLLAKKTGRPVVPVYMPYNYLVFPPHSFLIHWHPLKVVVGKPLWYQETDTDQSFAATVYEWFLLQQTERE